MERMTTATPGTAPRILAAARRQPVDRAPVWMMRQAGRYLPEYRAVREKADFLTMCRTPELAAEVTVQPVDILGVDAAILFSDILVPLEAMGFEVAFLDKGPRIANPVRALGDLDRVRVADAATDLPFVRQAVAEVCDRLAGRVPVIGFAGAPFTLACYAIDGGGSKDWSRTRRFLAEHPAAFAQLLDRLADTVASSLADQVRGGARMVQVFDSWGGVLDEATWRAIALPPIRKIVRALQLVGVPVTLYVGMSPHLVEAMVDSGADMLSLDWRCDLPAVMDRHGDKVALQGNVDPCLLYAAPERIRQRVRALAEAVAGRPGHVWNLGHGLLPDIPVAHVKAFVEATRDPMGAEDTR